MIKSPKRHYQLKITEQLENVKKYYAEIEKLKAGSKNQKILMAILMVSQSLMPKQKRKLKKLMLKSAR